MRPRRWSEEELRQREREVGLSEIVPGEQDVGMRTTAGKPAPLAERLGWTVFGMFILGLLVSAALPAKETTPLWDRPLIPNVLIAAVFMGPMAITLGGCGVYALCRFAHWVATGR